ncbi:PilT protein domain protein [Halovivax asiaticus JCM 14624]|uniref:PilT protein domain protein n=1 Tax=Halovivax asiaticus JCM 14624 TaxID=1227490 RepID=M0BIR0_9EURY|nr:PIN domain-containing protein [Halovivax asiaticus]ELZ10786.1 PilT protein domain protein [Halovivax asiaticus JCM 14624]
MNDSTVDFHPLFVDTGPLYARFDSADRHHDRTVSVLSRIREGSLRYRPLYTSRYVLGELTRLLLYNIGHTAASTALSTIRNSDLFVVLSDEQRSFQAACETFARYDDQTISLVDHLSAALAETHDIDHVFSFDCDFDTLGYVRVPDIHS